MSEPPSTEVGPDSGPRIGPVRLDDVLDKLPALQALRDHHATRLLVAGVVVGVVAGFAAGIFDRAILMVGEVVLGTPEPSSQPPVPWRALVGPVITGVVGAGLIAAATRKRRPQAVSDVLARVQTRDHRLSLRDGTLSAVGAALAVGGGHSGGREGPIVQLASTLAAKVVEILGVSPRYARALVAAGGAAGVAASFNTPVAGAFFALEILLGNFALDTFAPVIAATVTGTVMGQAMLGDRIALQLPAFTVHSPWELVLYAILGGVCGVVAAAFKRALGAAATIAGRLPAIPWLRGGLSGLVVGVIAAAGMPAVMGNGYTFMEELVTHADDFGLALLAVLLVAKMVATAATSVGRSGAGLFAPSLYVGAVSGTLLGVVFHRLFPGQVLTPGAYGMVGMAGVAAATLHAPITMTLMLFEMTRNYQVILPLLACVAGSTLASRMLGSESVYDLELKRQGIELGRGREELVMHDLRVADIMREDGFETVSSQAPVGDIVARFLARRTDVVFAVDGERRFVGVIDIQDAKRFFANPAATPAGAALAPRKVTTLRPDQRLSDAIGSFFDSPVEDLPVLDETGHLIGTLAERDVVAAYNREVLRQAVPLTRVVQDGPGGRRTDFLELPPGEALEVVDVPEWMAGRTLRELGLPSRYLVSVLAVRVPDPEGGPPQRRAALPETRLTRGEELVLLGPAEVVQALERGEEPAPYVAPSSPTPPPVEAPPVEGGGPPAA